MTEEEATEGFVSFCNTGRFVFGDQQSLYALEEIEVISNQWEEHLKDRS
jgi:hypothetical protein